MRRKQFSQLLYDLRAELGKSVDPSAGVADLPSLKQTLARNYETLYDDYDWPHLHVIPDRTTLSAGQRFYDFPSLIDADKVEEVVVWWNGQPLPLTRGIGFEHYAQFDSESDQRSDPVSHWDIRFTGTREQYEVWPMPASSTQTIQWRGKKKFLPLVDEADVCLIDDTLLVLTCAVELLPRQKSGDAKVKLSALQSRYMRLKGRSKGGSSASVRIGMGTGQPSSSIPSRATVRVGR